jgi:hypothetical protein
MEVHVVAGAPFDPKSADSKISLDATTPAAHFHICIPCVPSSFDCSRLMMAAKRIAEMIGRDEGKHLGIDASAPAAHSAPPPDAAAHDADFGS